MSRKNTCAEKPEYWVLSFSGGKDSTALGLEWLRRRKLDPITYPLDEVIYCDTGMEFPAMADHVARLERIFTDAGIKFTRLKAERSFEWYMFEYTTKRKNHAIQGVKGLGWPRPQVRWCTGELKNEVISRYVKQLWSQRTVVQLVGLAADEGYRLERKNNQDPSHRHPLIEWGWTEADCLKYCYDHGFDWSGAYQLFRRLSCWCCPLKSLAELRVLWKNFPDLWKRLSDLDHRSWSQFKKDYSVDQLEIRFRFEEERLSSGLSMKSRDFYKLLKQRLRR